MNDLPEELSSRIKFHKDILPLRHEQQLPEKVKAILMVNLIFFVILPVPTWKLQTPSNAVLLNVSSILTI